jgi:2-keto-4-pentenoate hydratase/2-oxohepta-3-ene-1,7-dioic acid hydratase in catechol pathway
VPAADDGRVAYEGELAIVIGRRAKNLSPVEQAAAHIFGYTCANDVTAMELLHRDPVVPQWTRAKGFDGFAAFGPVIETDFDPAPPRCAPWWAAASARTTRWPTCSSRRTSWCRASRTT